MTKEILKMEKIWEQKLKVHEIKLGKCKKIG